MAKYYVESGPVRLVMSAQDELHAAVRAFQWTCDRQAEIDAASPLEHVLEAERLGVQLGDVVFVNERGFGRYDEWRRPTIDVLEAWLDNPQPLV